MDVPIQSFPVDRVPFLNVPIQSLPTHLFPNQTLLIQKHHILNCLFRCSPSNSRQSCRIMNVLVYIWGNHNVTSQYLPVHMYPFLVVLFGFVQFSMLLVRTSYTQCSFSKYLFQKFSIQNSHIQNAAKAGFHYTALSYLENSYQDLVFQNCPNLNLHIQTYILQNILRIYYRWLISREAPHVLHYLLFLDLYPTQLSDRSFGPPQR